MLRLSRSPSLLISKRKWPSSALWRARHSFSKSPLRWTLGRPMSLHESSTRREYRPSSCSHGDTRIESGLSWMQFADVNRSGAVVNFSPEGFWVACLQRRGELTEDRYGTSVLT